MTALITELESVRIDKWLWAMRFFKSRELAKKAIENGKIQSNEQRIKCSRELKVGDKITISTPLYLQEVIIIKLHDKRLSAKIAITFYEETTKSLERKNKAINDKKLSQNLFSPPDHKPSKQARRKIIQFRRQSE